MCTGDLLFLPNEETAATLSCSSFQLIFSDYPLPVHHCFFEGLFKSSHENDTKRSSSILVLSFLLNSVNKISQKTLHKTKNLKMTNVFCFQDYVEMRIDLHLSSIKQVKPFVLIPYRVLDNLNSFSAPHCWFAGHRVNNRTRFSWSLDLSSLSYSARSHQGPYLVLALGQSILGPIIPYRSSFPAVCSPWAISTLEQEWKKQWHLTANEICNVSFLLSEWTWTALHLLSLEG